MKSLKTLSLMAVHGALACPCWHKTSGGGIDADMLRQITPASARAMLP